MSKVINLAPLFSAKHIVDELESQSGMEYFTLREKQGPAYRIDPEKLERIVDLAKRDSHGQMPWLSASKHDLELCHRFLRRTLIHKLALDMVDAGL